MGASPDPDAAGNLPFTNSLPEALREDHNESLHLAEDEDRLERPLRAMIMTWEHRKLREIEKSVGFLGLSGERTRRQVSSASVQSSGLP